MKKQVKKSLIIFSSLIGIAAIATTAIVTPIELTHKQDASTTSIVASKSTNPSAIGSIAKSHTVIPTITATPSSTASANQASNTNTSTTSSTTTSTSTNNTTNQPTTIDSNISNAYLSQLDSFLMQKNTFTSSQLDQMNKIIDNTNFFNDDVTGASLLANKNVNVDQANATMRSLAKDFVANMQSNGLQKDAIQTFLASKNVPAS